ncbi:uncharacterized protein LOC109861658 [Pseudomyrmex gracilis]|uniref:uncharacterized protein LOC109861658 n=1 Tax=Pseudomyrmex gracilis TaxID=219809 RepID=UPI000995D790|nr:uncharacterized protein LOC109861658 [Pseudomyrmex gracilis]
MNSGQKYFLIVSTDHFYCVPKKDLIVADADVPISTSVDIDFKYGTKTFRSSIVKISSKEKDILEEMTKLKKEKKTTRNSSFHERAPRKTALKQRIFMKFLQVAKRRVRLPKSYQRPNRTSAFSL